MFVSVQSPSTAQVEAPLALRHNPSTGCCLNSHIGQSTPCKLLPQRLPVRCLGLTLLRCDINLPLLIFCLYLFAENSPSQTFSS